MRYLSLIFIIFTSQLTMAQFIDIKLIGNIAIDADEFIGIDDFANLYYLKNNTFYKKTEKGILSYTNTQLGKITSVDIKNPLKIVLFYKDFNTIILLDNKLNELTNRIDFNSAPFSKNISMATGSSNNNLWLYSLDDNSLQLYNYKTEQIPFTSQSLSFDESEFKAKKLVSSYKNCWLLGENSILKFNDYGTFLNQFEIADVEDIKLLADGFVYLKDNTLYSYQNETTTLLKIKKEISIKSFYVNKDEIYIFDGTTIFVYAFTKK